MTRVPLPGIELIKQFEGIQLKAYPDPLSGGKPYTVGWGSTRRKDGSPFYLGEVITRAEADELLNWQVEQEFLPSLERIPVWPELNENQRGALLSFAYNLGADFYGSTGFDTLTRVLRDRDWNQIESALLLYRNPGSTVEAGLKRRRQAEADLFNTPPGEIPGRGEQPTPATGPRTLYLTQPPLIGTDVRDLQKALNRAGFSLEADGSFGLQTRRAVEQFQAAAGLIVDGIAGPRTQQTLNARMLYLSQPPLQGDDVRQVQQRLAALSIPVIVDGVFGPGTQQAVKTFQRRLGLFEDGVIGPRTWAKLI